MNELHLFKKWSVAVLVLTLLIGTLVVSQNRADAAANVDPSYITEWQMLWEQPGQPMTIEDVMALPDNEDWFAIHEGGVYPSLPDNVNSAWIKFLLPELTQMQPALGISELFAQNITVYINNKEIFQVERDYAYDRNSIVLPGADFETGKEVYLKLTTQFDRLGLQQAIIADEYKLLIKKSIRAELIDIIIGFSLVFIAFFMLVSTFFLNRSFMPGWSSLFIVMLSIGSMILSYSSFMDRFFPELGKFLYYLFDVASIILLPALFIFFERIFGEGPYRIIKRLNKIQMVSLFIMLGSMIISMIGPEVEAIYRVISMIYLSSTLIIGNIIILITLILYCIRRVKEAIIMAFGLGIFSIIGISEILIYFISDSIYLMNYWKFGVVLFLASLIVVLVRRIMNNYEIVLEYSRQIEVYNIELQRSEKIELISHLAASIAHEVRNPLQVTRGFLQITRDRISEEKSKSFMTLAIEELDRAAEIITDFLTFAKPDLVELSKLDVVSEIMQIEALLVPLATMNGSVLKVKLESELFVTGNSSKFKQALINIIKNSIEALNDNGEVIISVFKNADGFVEIIIQDNGEGIDKEDLKRLGDPYYSKKTKGTGLGLMVTFRIIEAMQGEIIFNSVKGEGTEVKILLPAS